MFREESPCKVSTKPLVSFPTSPLSMSKISSTPSMASQLTVEVLNKKDEIDLNVFNKDVELIITLDEIKSDVDLNDSINEIKNYIGLNETIKAMKSDLDESIDFVNVENYVQLDDGYYDYYKTDNKSDIVEEIVEAMIESVINKSKKSKTSIFQQWGFNNKTFLEIFEILPIQAYR